MNPRTGFTLLELLVAMTLLGLLGVMAAGGVRFGLAAWQRGGETGMAATEARQALKAVRRLIDSARPIPLRLQAGDRPAVLFTGAPDHVTFAAPLPAALAPPGDFLLDLRLSGGRLMLRAAPLSHARPTLDAGSLDAVLIEGLTAVRFRYFGPMPVEDDDEIPVMGWQESWAGRTMLPTLVAVDLDWAEDAPLALHPARQPGVVARLGAARI
ncbi:MAG: prepilin-type N-terminal cleavage/methylation domain-containing protein, partial [Pseudomonadota bacterium]